MKPYFLQCLKCKEARVWHYKDENYSCRNGCHIRWTQPWYHGFGPDEKPVIDHPSSKYDPGDQWPDTKIPDFYVSNKLEMKRLCR